MRIVYSDENLAKTKAEEAVAHTIGPMVSNDDNASISVQRNPLKVIMYDYNGGDSRISADITSYMNGYDDPRRAKYFTKSTFDDASNGYYGLRNGINISSSTTAQKYSNINLSESKNRLIWMNVAEVLFIKSEGALRGWNMGGTSEDFYNQGIALSFQQWGLSNSDSYLNDNSSTSENYVDPLGSNNNNGALSTITIKYNTSDNFEENLERIITQKWIANFPLGLEAWAEFRRTGYPSLMRVPHNLSKGIVSDEKMARRLPYPQDEYTENGTNLQEALKNLGGPDNMATNVWWDNKN